MKYLSILLLLFTVVLFIGCGSKSKEDEAADILKQSEEMVKTGKLSDGIKGYERIMNEFGETKSAPEAHLKTAYLYRDSLITNMDMSSKMKKSAELFTTFADKFSDNKEAPNSLFNAGYIYENILGDFKSATDVYNKFLSKYPNHELADDVKLCLDNMGKTPEEMLEQLQKKNK